MEKDKASSHHTKDAYSSKQDRKSGRMGHVFLLDGGSDTSNIDSHCVLRPENYHIVKHLSWMWARVATSSHLRTSPCICGEWNVRITSCGKSGVGQGFGMMQRGSITDDLDRIPFGDRCFKVGGTIITAVCMHGEQAVSNPEVLD